VPVAGGRKTAVFGGDRAPRDASAGAGSGGLGGRDRHSPEPEDRPGLDAPRATETGADAGQERETLSGRGPGCADEEPHCHRRPAEGHGSVRAAALGVDAALSAGEEDPRRSGQLRDSHDQTGAGKSGDSAGTQAASAFSAAVLSGPQPNRTDVGGSARQRDAEPPLPDDAKADAQRSQLHPPAQPPATVGGVGDTLEVFQNRCR